MVTRRRFVTAASVAASAATAGCAARPMTTAATTAESDNGAPFQHGIASGDPLSDRVILWTRVTVASSGPVPVRWEIASDPDFRRIVDQGVVTALPVRDHTVKVDAMGLEPARTYYYRFNAAGAASPTGRTRTLPDGVVSRTRIAVASCSNLPFGYFSAYRHIAARGDVDLVLHLGDYFYEYAPKVYGDGSALGRVHEPPREVVTLADYRIRHAQYKRDPDLQEAHRQHPWICVWDDHESANNSWRDGAENHNPELGEGSWTDRRAAAVRAYHEWLPIREQPGAAGAHIYRSFRLGDLAHVIMLDTRLHGRTRQLEDRSDQAGLNDPARTILGLDQQAWLAEELRASVRLGSRWRLLGQQLMFAQLIAEDGLLLNVDQWDGYPDSRRRILDQLEAERIDDTVVLTGDIHTAWAMDVSRDPLGAGYDRASGRGSLAVEMVTTSVTSPGPDGSPEELIAREATIVRDRPHIHYVNLRQHGYLLLDLDHRRAQGEWWYVDSLDDRSAGEAFGVAFATESGSNHLEPVASPSSSNGDRPASI
ncbi:MAG: alkaline phosphatase D family protein [Pseudomonadales bacterium]